MKALTLWRPWARYVANGEKRIENRPWTPPLKMIGERIAIHAGLRLDHEAVSFVDKVLGRSCLAEKHEVGIIGTAKLLGWYELSENGHVLGTTGIEYTEVLRPGHGYREVPIEITARDREWSFGPFCWVLRDAVTLSAPVMCRGMQKLWNISPAIQTELDAALAATPVQAVLPCPKCGRLHVDRGEWAGRLHHTHRCEFCQEEWPIHMAPPHHSTYAVGIEP